MQKNTAQTKVHKRRPIPSSFENFSLDALNSEQKPSVKKNGRPGRSENG